MFEFLGLNLTWALASASLADRMRVNYISCKANMTVTSSTSYEHDLLCYTAKQDRLT